MSPPRSEPELADASVLSSTRATVGGSRKGLFAAETYQKRRRGVNLNPDKILPVLIRKAA